jgi:translation initiation factor IF-2
MFDSLGKKITEASASMPISLKGVDEVPNVGSVIRVVTDDDSTAIEKPEDVDYGFSTQGESLVVPDVIMFDSRQTHSLQDPSFSKVLSVIVKGDQSGSIQSVMNYVSKLPRFNDCFVQIIDSGVGDICDSDIELAHASQADIVGFNVKLGSDAKKYIKSRNVSVRIHTSSIVYDLLDQIDVSLSVSSFLMS